MLALEGFDGVFRVRAEDSVNLNIRQGVVELRKKLEVILNDADRLSPVAEAQRIGKEPLGLRYCDTLGIQL